MREITVENYLKSGIEALEDGLCIKIPPAGRNNQPDRLILLKFVVPHEVELKAPGKLARDKQTREHARHCERNMPVYVLDTVGKVDAHLRNLNFFWRCWRISGRVFTKQDLIEQCPDNLSR